MQQQQTKITELATRIAAHARARGWSTARLVREIPAVGSERTFRDMLAGQFKGYNLEAQEANLAAAAALIDDLNATSDHSRICDNLGVVLDIRRAALSAMSAAPEDTARVVLVRGPSGSGKTTAARVLAGLYGQRIALMEADATMDGSPSAFLGALLAACGKPAGAPAAATRMAAAVEALRLARRCLVIDEAHHLGIRNLNCLKTLVNRTPGEFVLLAIPKLWSDLERSAYQEAVQLTTNRLSECVQVQFTAADAAKYLSFSRPDLWSDAKAATAAARQVAEYAPGRGNWAFARDVARIITTFSNTADEATAVAGAIATIRRRRGEGANT
jgi:DNA transposition AAA+ family ATPase